VSLFINSLQNKKGQATVELVLLMVVVILLYTMISKELFEKQKLGDKLATPLQNQYPKVYRNGLPYARGLDDPGGAFYHPRVNEQNNFRIFIHNNKSQ